MLVPAALEQWAAEHSEQLSPQTVSEVRTIGDTIASSSLSGRSIHDVGEDFGERLAAVFPESRAERAATLVKVVSDWAAKQPADPAPAQPVEPEVDQPDLPPAEVSLPLAESSSESANTLLPIADTPLDLALEEPIESPAFLRSDKVDEEDDVRLYGPKRPWKAIAGTFLVLALLGGAGVGAWYWYDQRTDDTIETATPAEPTAEQVVETQEQPEPTAAPTVAPTPIPEPTPVLPSFWADTVPILNSGSAEIAASTYAVSPANRAVLTGHTAAITGVVVSDDGRVLTSGADRRLVDWGSDVTLANPDVLNVPSPLTVLARTVDQRVIAGDSTGSITILDLVNTVDPVVLPIHPVAISALVELADGRFAIASVDGDVDLVDIEDADARVTLAHDDEVTAVVGLDDGTIATAAVDGVIRLWSAEGEEEPAEISTLDAPVTALTLLASGQLAAASVEGAIHIVAPVAQATADTVLPGHTGAVRSLFEITLPDDSVALASGGDDTTVRLWDIAEATEIRVLEGHGDIISGLDSLPDGRLVSTSGDGTGRVWDLSVPSGQPVIAPHDWNLSALHVWNNDQFVTGGVDGKVVLASTAVTSEPLLITEHDAPVVGVSVLQSGDIVSLDASSVMRINQSTGALSGLIEVEVSPGATALSVRADEGVVTGHADGTVRFHNLAEETLVVSAHGSGVNDVVSLSNGQVVSAGQDMTVRIIDPENPDSLPVFDLHTGPVDVVIELPDGRIASAGSDGIFIFSLEGLAQDHVRLNGQRARTISLVALPGNRLISTGEDGRVRLWDLANPDEEPTTLVDIPGVVNPHLIQAGNGLFVSGAARGYVVFTLN